MAKPARLLPTIFATSRYFSPYKFILPLITLAACAGSPAHPIAANPTERDLFVESSEDILEFHLKSAHPDQIAMDGLNQLAKVDPALSLERAGDHLLLHYGDETRRFDAPAEG